MSDLLGRLRVLSRAQGKTFVGEMLDEAANEIERLRQNIGCARDQRTTQYCAEVYAAEVRSWNEAIEAAIEACSTIPMTSISTYGLGKAVAARVIADAIRRLRKDEE